MATISLPVYTLLISLIISVSGQNIPDLRCYYCESQKTKACDDPVDVSVLPLVDCRDVAFQLPSREENTRSRSLIDQAVATSVDGKFRGEQPIQEVFEKNIAQRSQKTYKYVCLKAVLTADELRATTRTCVKVLSDVKDTCDFLQQEVDPKFKIKSCYACENDKCNSASFLSVSGITITFSMLIFIFKRIF